MRKFLLLAVFLFLSVHPASAQVVTVDGMGADRDSAVRDASRKAVMQVVGTFIDSNTLVENAMVELDEIYAKSQGFVRNIKILEERQVGEDYRVRASIDVDTRPDASLMDRLTLLMRTNDPRIAVIVLGDTNDANGTFNAGNGHDIISESVMSDRLIELGFSHVVDANHVIKLQNAQLLNSIYNGQTGLSGVEVDRSVDYLVLGKSRVDAYRVSVPNQLQGGYSETQLTTAKADLTVKVLKFDTGDMIGSYSVEGQGVENNQVRAANKALTAAAGKAAQELEKKFKQFASKTSQGGLQMTVHADDYGKIEQLIGDLNGVSGVENVYVREHGNGKAVLEIDSMQKPHTIIQLLKKRTKLGIFVEGVTNSGMQLTVS